MDEMKAPPMRQGMRRYVLIDRGQDMEIPEELLWRTVAPPWLAEVQSQLPILLDMEALGAQPQDVLRTWTEQAHHSEAGCGITLLDTAASADALVEHLCNSMLWDGHEGRRHLLRYFDARVMAQLEWLLHGAAWTRLLGPVHEWHLFLDGGWHCIAAEAGQVFVPTPSGMDTATALTWLDVITPAITTASPKDVKHRQRMAQRAFALLWTAQKRFSLRERKDLALFAEHGLSLHPEFHDHPLVRRPLEQLHGSDMSYRALMAHLDTDTLQRIRADLIHLRGEPQ